MKQEFESAYPSDYQIKKLFGVGCKISTEGDDLTIYVNRESDNYPIGELHCIDFDSLSPIRKESNKVSCPQCNILVIRNVVCHETGCINASKGYYKGNKWIEAESENEEGLEED
jgi:ribosomal protein L32